MPDDYTPHIDAAQHNFKTDAAGKFTKVTTVQYHIGTLGPFFQDFPDGADSSIQINSFLNAKSQELRNLLR